MAARFKRKVQSEREKTLLAKSDATLACGIRSASINPDYSMVMTGGKGAKVFDASGNEYIDYLLGSGPMFLGHAHPAMVDAVHARVAEGNSFLLTNDAAIDLAADIVDIVPCAEKVSFHNSGSEATQYALRLARAYRGRDKMLKFEGAYHGMHDHALMSAQWTMKVADFPKAVCNSAGITSQTENEVLIAPFNDLEKTAEILRAHQDELGCVMVEPLCRTFVPAPGFLQGLRDITSELDIPLVFDEVVTGFRLALGGAQEFYGVVPDLCAGAKAISGGLPFGFVGGRSDIMDLAGRAGIEQRKHVRLTGTYSGNVLSTSVASALIKELKAPGVYEEVNTKGLRLKNALSDLLRDADIPAQVLGEATAFQPWFVDGEEVHDHRSSLGLNWKRHFKLQDLLLDRGVLKGQEKFFVSTAHSDADIDFTIAALADSMGELKET
ncbi:MAG: aspartate aminotransferase family protein [Pseudomonadales bacterium]